MTRKDQQSNATNFSPQGQRLDLWLWYARFAKSRTLAQVLIERGKARVNRERISKTSHIIKAGDVVTLSLGPRVRVIAIKGLGIRRGPATEAAALFEELTPAPDRTTSARRVDGSTSTLIDTEQAPLGIRDAGSGRPTKRERRQTERLKDRFNEP